MRIKPLIAVLACGWMTLWLASCTLPIQGSAGRPEAWIDAPLTGDSVALDANVDVMSHSSDSAGIANVELSVNDAVVNTANVPESGQTYVLMKQKWTPNQPGTYQLRVRAQNSAGHWSQSAVAIVVVVRVPAAAPAQTASATSTATATAQPTATVTPQPPAASTASVSIQSISTNQVYLGGASCGPLDVTITAHATAPNGITVVVLFYGLPETSSSAFQSMAMNPLGGDLYQGNLNPTSILGGSGAVSQTTLDYQVVVQQENGDTSLRTPVLSDISVQACGSPAPPACSPYTDQRSCQSHGCNWVSKPGIVPINVCQNP